MASEKPLQVKDGNNNNLAESNDSKSWMDLDRDLWFRGEPLPNVERRCLELCAEFIGGRWTAATDPEKDLEVKRITGGLTNQLYRVTLKDHVPAVSNRIYPDEPRDVAIKFYLPKLVQNVKGNNERLSDTIIVLLASQLDIGPKLYGLFEGGMIQSFHEHEQFGVKHQQNDRLLRILLHKLAQIHLLQVPISKATDGFHQENKKSLHSAYTELNIRDKFQEYGLETFCKHDLKEEFDDYEKTVFSLPQRIVFCHNDFRSSNILVVGNDPSTQRLVLCDFEYGSYGVRGHDLASITLEWDLGGWTKESFSSWVMPSRQVLEKLAQFYLEGCDSVQPGYSSLPGNSVDNIIRDIKLGLLEYLMLFVTFQVNARESLVTSVEFNQREYLELGEVMYALYWRLKRQFIAEGIVSFTKS